MEPVSTSLEALIKDSFPGLSHASTRMSAQAAADASHLDTPTLRTPSRSPMKARSLSESSPKLAPSPALKEDRSRGADDSAISTLLSTPDRPTAALGLSLCLPPRDLNGPGNLSARVPTSPKVDARSPYGSPASVLPRRSRGLDFSRAATRLHHTILAEASPDSSPITAQKGVMIPGRTQSINAMMVDPPSWSGPTEKHSAAVGSLGSVNMFASDDSSSDGGDEPMDPEEQEDPILCTPNLNRKSVGSMPNPMATPWGHNFFSPTSSNFLSYRRKVNEYKSRKSSSSASGRASPAPTSPALTKGGEGSYFPRDVNMLATKARRESLSLGTTELHISSGNESGDESARIPFSANVIRRAVTRRSNLLPKTRAFGRIKADLIEEATPVDSEVKREAEVVRQVRESDAPVASASTTHSSPSMQPLRSMEEAPEDLQGGSNQPALDGSAMSNTGSSGKGLFGAFARSSGNKDFWDKFDHQMTPPPLSLAHCGSSGDDIAMDSPSTTNFAQYPMDAPGTIPSRAPSRSSTPQPPTNGPSAAQGLRKNAKRRRDDDFDTSSLKRRAVSPGLSVSNSPVLTQSPAHRGDLWGNVQLPPPKVTKESSTLSNTGCAPTRERSSSVSSAILSTPSVGPRRVGLQGVTDMQGMTEKMTLE